MDGQPPFSILGGPISVLKSSSKTARNIQADSPGAESSSSDEGLTMSIYRQQGWSSSITGWRFDCFELASYQS